MLYDDPVQPTQSPEDVKRWTMADPEVQHEWPNYEADAGTDTEGSSGT